jgi:hypothetical protein
VEVRQVIQKDADFHKIPIQQLTLCSILFCSFSTQKQFWSRHIFTRSRWRDEIQGGSSKPSIHVATCCECFQTKASAHLAIGLMFLFLTPCESYRLWDIPYQREVIISYRNERQVRLGHTVSLPRLSHMTGGDIMLARTIRLSITSR